MENELDHIEKYIKGRLSADEMLAFEERLSDDADLRESVDNHRQLLRGIDIGFNRDLKDKLREVENKQPQVIHEKATATRKIGYFAGIAATIGLILISIFILKKPSIDTQEVFAQYYQPYPNVEAPVIRSDANNENAYALYEQGRYHEALDFFDTLNKKNPLDPAPLFYAGICQIELKDPESASSYFEVVSTLESNKYTRPAIWYGALANLQQKNVPKARDLFLKLAGGDDNYAFKAGELLEELDE